MLGATVVNRVRSIVTGTSFSLVETPEPFSFTHMPQTVIDGAVRVTLDGIQVRTGMAYSEERIDEVGVFVAKVSGADAGATTRSLHTLATSLTSAIVRDGCGAGDFAVGDQGRRVQVQRDPTATYQVLRLTLPVSYMLSL